MSNFLLGAGCQTLMLELQEASRLPEHLGGDFIRAAGTVTRYEGKLTVSGIGKSGHIDKELAVAFASTDTPAYFAHPAEVLYGDLGMSGNRDMMLFISYSGNVRELGFIVPWLEEKPIPLLAMIGRSTSSLVLVTKAVLDIAVGRRACPMHLAPASNTVNILMLSDVLAMVVVQVRGFNEEDFARSYPAGALGTRLLNKVHHLMRRDEEAPRVDTGVNIMDVMLEFDQTELGPVAVCDKINRVQDVFADGDLRRWLVTGDVLDDNITRVMTRSDITLQMGSHAVEAKERLMRHKISTAPVVDENGQLAGAINLQNFYQAGIL